MARMTVIAELGEDLRQGCHSSELQKYCFLTVTVALLAPSPKIRIKPHHPSTRSYEAYYTNCNERLRAEN